jgi:hypothetical protein
MVVSSIALGLGLSGNILKDDNINKNNIDKTIKQINRNYINRYNSNEIEKNRNIIYSLNEDNYIKSIKPNTNMINKIWREQNINYNNKLRNELLNNNKNEVVKDDEILQYTDYNNENNNYIIYIIVIVIIIIIFFLILI